MPELDGTSARGSIQIARPWPSTSPSWPNNAVPASCLRPSWPRDQPTTTQRSPGSGTRSTRAEPAENGGCRGRRERRSRTRRGQSSAAHTNSGRVTSAGNPRRGDDVSSRNGRSEDAQARPQRARGRTRSTPGRGCRDRRGIAAEHRRLRSRPGAGGEVEHAGRGRRPGRRRPTGARRRPERPAERRGSRSVTRAVPPTCAATTPHV